MLLILTVLVLAVAAIIIIARRQASSALLNNQTPNILDRENLRPLFAPDEVELRAIESEQRDLAEARAKDEAALQAKKVLASFEEFRQTWRQLPNRPNTIELILRASETESGVVFLDVLDELLHKRPEALSADDLAQLIESHFWLLPKHERTPGVTFTINRELAALRGVPQAKSEEEASDD